MSRTLRAKFSGGWCDTCQIAAATKRCPSCDQPMRPAKVLVEPLDVADDEWPNVLGGSLR